MLIKFKNKLKRTLYRLENIIFRHHSLYRCNCCNNAVRKFIPGGGVETNEHLIKYDIIGSRIEMMNCPHCNVHDRIRHLMMYNEKLHLWKKYVAGKAILHIAPETYFVKLFKEMSPKVYVMGDLYPHNKGLEKIDITSLSYPIDSFDFIMCNHVLEHIVDDIKAMKEIYRVLKPGGIAILQTPYAVNIEKSYERYEFRTDAERAYYYGQADHVRIYGKDFFTRLRSVGFKLHIIENKDLFTDELCDLHGVNNRENLILVEK